MKSAYELAMERLEEDAPSVALSDEQKAKIAEIEEKFKAKIASRELKMQEQINSAVGERDPAEILELETHLSSEIARYKEECEAEKAAVRDAG